MIFALQWIFCVHKAYIFLTPPFIFGINIGFVIAKEEFQKNFYYSRIKLIIQKPIWKILLTCHGHVTEQKMKKYSQPSDSAPGILGHVPIPRTCLGHFQLSEESNFLIAINPLQ